MAVAEGNADRISNLPDPLLHYILSFVPVKDSAKTSILSKRWNHIWTTLPYLDFGPDFLKLQVTSGKHRYVSKQLKKNKHSLKVANKIVLSRRQQIACIEKLHLVIPDHENPKRRNQLKKRSSNPLDFKLEGLMSCVANRGLKELKLQVKAFSRRFHKLPSTILSAKSLNVLSLHGFDLMLLSYLDTKFPSLQKLALVNVSLEDDILGKLIRGCPLLENLQLHYSVGVKTICTTGLLKLKVLDVGFLQGLEILEIEAPDLQALTVIVLSPSCKVNVTTCSSLRDLTLSGGFLTKKWFHHLVSECLFLENLYVHTSTALENINISSDTLKTLKLSFFNTAVGAEINAPNLENFLLIASEPSPISLNASHKLEVELQFCPTEVDDLWHNELAKFLGYFNHFNTIKFSHGSRKAIILPKEKRDNLLSPLYDTHNLIFYTGRMKFDVLELVEYMLWLCPRIETLSITCPDRQNREKTDTVLKFHYEKNAQENPSSPCCKFLPI